MEQGRKRTSGSSLGAFSTDEFDEVSRRIANVDRDLAFLGPLFFDRNSVMGEPCAHLSILPTAGEDREMIEIAAGSRSFERPAAVRIGGIDEDDPG